VLRRRGGEVVCLVRRLGDAPELGFAANFKVVPSGKEAPNCSHEGIKWIHHQYFRLRAAAWQAQASHGKAIVFDRKAE